MEHKFETDSLDFNPSSELTTSADLCQVMLALLALRLAVSMTRQDLLHKIVGSNQVENRAWLRVRP